jgi:uncharacterized protein (DUF433 family)
MTEQLLLQHGDAQIIERGRGPEIKGTRITVYDICDYERKAWPNERTAAWLKLTVQEVEAARFYIDRHRAEVMAEYQKMLDREKRGNPPEVQAKLDAIAGTARRKLEEFRRAKAVAPGARDAGDNGRQ